MANIFNKLSSLLFNKNNKPYNNAHTLEKKKIDERDSKYRARIHNYVPTRNVGTGGSSVLQLGNKRLIGSGQVSDEARKYGQSLLDRGQLYKTGSSGSGNGSGGGGYIDDGSGGGSSGGGSSGSGSSGSGGSVKSSMSKSERDKLYKMKDSNVPYYYKHDENDLMYLAASEKRDFVWGLKEEVFLYTMHDRKKHRYITSFNIDSDADNICSSCQIEMPYKEELMEYYIPGQTVFMIIGGTFDREVLFVGRVSEIAQLGDTIRVTGQNVGWKFKQYMSDKFYKKIQGLPVPMVVKAIFKQLGFTEGKYHMDLWAIPNVFKYKLDEDATIKYKGETVENVPELKDVVKRMKDSDINKYVASKANVRSTQSVANNYEESVKKRLSSVVLSSTSGYSSPYRKNYGITTSIKDGKIEYDPIEDMILGSDKSYEYFTDDSSGNGEYTYEEVMQNIAAAIDAQFFIVDTTVCFVSFNSLMALSSSEAIVKSIQPRIPFWQVQDKSFELDVNQYGYYNTVIIKYKNGVLKRSFEDLVRVYGEIAVTYKEPELNYEAAQLKAQAYLAAHVRDFGMTVKFTILYTGKITVASFIKVQNPLTSSESLLYVYGINVHWSAENETILCDVDCRYGPENPDNPEIPEYGLSYSNTPKETKNNVTGHVSADVTTAAQQICGSAFTNDQRVELLYDWMAKNVSYREYWNSEHSVSVTLQGKSSNCDDSSECFYQLCTAAGIPCEKIHGTLYGQTGSWGHYWCKVEYQGKMVIADLGRGVKAGLGKYNGRLAQDRVDKKNY